MSNERGNLMLKLQQLCRDYSAVIGLAVFQSNQQGRGKGNRKPISCNSQEDEESGAREEAADI